jgi:hypothetical protein
MGTTFLRPPYPGKSPDQFTVHRYVQVFCKVGSHPQDSPEAKFLVPDWGIKATKA